ncbi:MAG TPA: DUF1003 domain-containing protein [Candidatus Dormibacteraeota bacterium]|jgi:uncharacterized membrane protein
MSTAGTKTADHEHADIHRPWGGDAFGRAAERFARLFGTPRFIAAQTVVVALWIAFNAVAAASRWDPYPFILLNLVFSTQAAYAAPLILLAATRQADRDKHAEDLRQAADTVAEKHRAVLASQGERLLEQNTEMTRQLVTLINENTDLTRSIAELTRQVHAQLAGGSAPAT